MTHPTSASVVEIERRLQWRWLGLVGFLAIIVTLTVMAAVSLLVPARRVAGLPPDPEVQAVAATLQGRLPVLAGGLRFRSALTGEAAPGAVFGAAEARLAERAAASLASAARRLPGDERLEVARGHLDLVLGHLDPAGRRYFDAERRYRAVTARGRETPEARLGIGLALALQARTERHVLRARALRLEALSQWVAVSRDDPAWTVALYDRALLLVELGRHAEAEAVAREYLALDPSEPWAGRLRQALAVRPD
jgi:tetratricopeptide (TPR) repeat protein